MWHKLEATNLHYFLLLETGLIFLKKKEKETGIIDCFLI